MARHRQVLLTQYNEAFYQYQMEGSLRSAEIVVPLVLDLLGAKSVVDVGCGAGTWLSIYRKNGIEDILGIDGEYVNRDLLLIDDHLFRAHDLSRPLGPGRRFDLAQSLEVAEHIDSVHAGQFISGLVQLSDVVLFSAAVPCQLGTGHVNEQFVDYWIDLFREHSYRPVDFIRPQVWSNEAVEICYRQNMLLFVSADAVVGNPRLEGALESTNPDQLSLIHPDLYRQRMNRVLNMLFDIARKVQSNGNVPLAQSAFASILDIDPANSKTWNAFGQLAAQANNIDMAITYMKRAVELEPAEAGFQYNLGQVYAASGLAEKAQDHYTRALEARPDDPVILAALARLSE